MTKKPALLAVAACVGGLAALLWPVLAQRVRFPVSQGDGPHFVSAEEAQRQVSYPFWVPHELPGGGQMMGAVVYRVKAPDLPGEIARARAQQHYHTGYGLALVDQYGVVSVFSAPGSPAERAGIGGSPRPLLAIAGHTMVGKTLKAAGAAARRARPLLTITYRAPDGAARTVVLRRERYLTRPAVPHVYRGKLAIVDFRVRGRSLGLYEMPVGEGEPPHGYHQRWVKAAGLAVLLADSEQGPLAFWTRGPTRFELDNLGGTLSQAETLNLVQSMYLPNYQARR